MPGEPTWAAWLAAPPAPELHCRYCDGTNCSGLIRFTNDHRRFKSAPSAICATHFFPVSFSIRNFVGDPYFVSSLPGYASTTSTFFDSSFSASFTPYIAECVGSGSCCPALGSCFCFG